MLSIVSGIIAGISFVAGSPTIAFTAVVITGVTAAYAIYISTKISSMNQNLRDKGLTLETQSKLGVTAFENALKETKKWDITSFVTFDSKVRDIFEGILSFKWIGKYRGIVEIVQSVRNGYEKEWDTLNLCVEEKSVDSKTESALLNLAVNNKVVLYFSSLQKQKRHVEVSDTYEFIKERVKDSVIISALFVQNCLKSSEISKLDVEAINRQLKALALKFYSEIDLIETYQTLFPSVQIRRNEDNQLTIELTSNRFVEGAEDDVGVLIAILNFDGIKIEIIGEGWKHALNDGKVWG
ncbi:MAG: hypothetical protein H0W50_10035, partial [Parachlamydiaceae bacterium]|nr:hypothetical protein [Parachlamydiaceae bacterium]